jgi:hypothetical protein
MRIGLIVEGETEKAFLPYLRVFLRPRLAGMMPKLDSVPYDGRIPTGDKLKRVVERLLHDSQRPADAVIALTDVYTGTTPPIFMDAADAREKMRGWVGNNDRFYPHAAQHDFEAWLLPYWDEIQKLAGSNRTVLGTHPELINHNHPPAHRIREVFRTGQRGRAYVKPRDAGRILRGKDLLVAAQACPELKSFLNTILTVCSTNAIP